MSGSPSALSLLVRHFLLLALMTSSLLYAEATAEKPCGTTVYSGNRITSRIVNGNKADILGNPWMVQVHTDRGRCGGSIINSEYVLTAAHCVFDKLKGKRVPESGVRVATGETWWEPRKGEPVEEVFVHDGYNPATGVENDIALLKLKYAVEMKNGQNGEFDAENSICLPKKNVGNLSSLTCKAAGWGLLETGGKNSQHLMEVNLNIADPETCQKHTPATLYEVSLCASAPNKGICDGDSGGPLVCQNKEDNSWFLAGIASFGPAPCAKKGTYSGFVDVSKYLDWIDKITKDSAPSMDSWVITVETGRCNIEMLTECSHPGTDGNVSIGIEGTTGKTDWIALTNGTDNSWTLFEEGQTDVFSFKTLPVGVFKKAYIQLVLQHRHRDDSWKCRKVTVHQENKDSGISKTREFNCSWMEDGTKELPFPF